MEFYKFIRWVIQSILSNTKKRNNKKSIILIWEKITRKKSELKKNQIRYKNKIKIK